MNSIVHCTLRINYVVLTLNFLLTLTLNISTILVINGLDSTITAKDIIQCFSLISDKLNISLPIGVKNASTIIPNIDKHITVLNLVNGLATLNNITILIHENINTHKVLLYIIGNLI